MGLVEEKQKMANLEYRKARQEAEKATKEAEKLQKQLDKIKEEKQTRKEYERDLKFAVEKDLESAFIKVIDKYGIEQGSIYLNLKTVREDILQQVPENEEERDFAERNYYKILKKTEEVYKRDIEAKKKIEAIKLTQALKEVQKKQEEEQKKEEKQQTILNIICFILLLPFKILGYILFAIAGLLAGALKSK